MVPGTRYAVSYNGSAWLPAFPGTRTSRRARQQSDVLDSFLDGKKQRFVQRVEYAK